MEIQVGEFLLRVDNCSNISYSQLPGHALESSQLEAQRSVRTLRTLERRSGKLKWQWKINSFVGIY